MVNKLAWEKRHPSRIFIVSGDETQPHKIQILLMRVFPASRE